MASDKNNSAQFITQNDVMKIIKSEVSQLHNATGLDPDRCLTLLLKFGFDKESILEKYNENKRFLVENGSVPAKTEEIESEECSVCCLNNQLFSLACGHSACRTCWQSYLARRIENGHFLIECVDSECKLLIGKSFINGFLGNSERYESLTIDSFVKTNRTITKCPEASCKLFVKTNSAASQSVTCTCGHTFCFHCGQDPHFPATCRQRQLWNKKCELLTPKIDDGSQQWLLEYTKECPKCLVTVEKQGGCTVMSCPNKKCQHCFCWMCRAAIATHGRYFCDSIQLNAEKARLDARADLSNFITHYRRFEHYQKIYENIPQIFSNVLKSSKPFVRKVTKSYFNGRKMLINSVVFGFFLRNGKYSLEFEKLQHKLERSTDQLESSLLNFLSNRGSKKIRSKLFDHLRDIKECQSELFELCAKGQEFEDLDGQNHRDAWKKAHDARVNYDHFSELLKIFLFFIVITLALHFILPDFKTWLPDFIVAYGQTLGIDLRNDGMQRGNPYYDAQLQQYYAYVNAAWYGAGAPQLAFMYQWAAPGVNNPFVAPVGLQLAAPNNTAVVINQILEEMRQRNQELAQAFSTQVLENQNRTHQLITAALLLDQHYGGANAAANQGGVPAAAPENAAPPPVNEAPPLDIVVAAAAILHRQAAEQAAAQAGQVAAPAAAAPAPRRRARRPAVGQGVNVRTRAGIRRN